MAKSSKLSYDIRIVSDGTWKNTQVYVADIPIPCSSLYITGDKEVGLTCALSLSTCTEVQGTEEANDYEIKQPLIGFHDYSQDEYYEDDEDE